jgi:hypothetical protein
MVVISECMRGTLTAVADSHVRAVRLTATSGLPGSPEAFQRFAEDYYETAVDITAALHVYAGRPLSQDVASALNPGASLAELAEVAAQIGYSVLIGPDA